MSKSRPSLLARLGRYLVSKIIPARTRRADVLASLYATLSGNTPSLTQLTALNNALKLVKSPSALQLPSRIPHAYWGNGDLICAQTNLDDKEALIMANMPKGFLYANVRDVAGDIRTLLEFVEVRKSSQAINQETREAVRLVATA